MNILYRIFSYILLVIAVFLGVLALLFLIASLGNAALLLSAFVITGVVLYSISSFLFLVNGIDGKQNLKARLKDLIKVNGFVSIFFVLNIVALLLPFIIDPSKFSEVASEMTKSQRPPFILPEKYILVLLKLSGYFFLLYSLVLGYHLLKTFQYLKQYAHLFGEKNNHNPVGGSF